MEFEDWLQDVPAVALRELGGFVESRSKPVMVAFILEDPESRDLAEESMRIEAEAHERMRTYPASPSELWAKRFTLPW